MQLGKHSLILISSSYPQLITLADAFFRLSYIAPGRFGETAGAKDFVKEKVGDDK